jgi:hypothetical protein
VPEAPGGPPEDRFADLGPRERRSAAERFEELDEREPEPQPKPPRSPLPTGRYAWLVGIVFVFALIVAGANALRHSGAGFRGVPPGKRLAPFAAPLVSSNLNKDANLQPRASHGVPAACDVHLSGVVNLCDLRRRPLVMTFVANGGAGCDAQLDRVERVRGSFRGANFLGVISRKSLADAKKMASSHGWHFLALDRDAQLLNLYGIGDCPTTIFVRRGGISAGTRRGALREARLAADVRALVQGQPIP